MSLSIWGSANSCRRIFGATIAPLCEKECRFWETSIFRPRFSLWPLHYCRRCVVERKLLAEEKHVLFVLMSLSMFDDAPLLTKLLLILLRDVILAFSKGANSGTTWGDQGGRVHPPEIIKKDFNRKFYWFI